MVNQKILFLLFFLFCQTAFSANVAKVLDRQNLALEGDIENWQIADPLVAYNQEGKAIAYLRVRVVQASGATAEIVSWLAREQILVGDKVLPFFVNRKNEVDGHTILLQRNGSKKIWARYKPLLFTGSETLSETAATLGRGEHQISVLTTYSFGITDRLSIGTVAIANFLRVYNMKVKYNCYSSEHLIVSAAYQYNYLKSTHTNTLTLYVDSPNDNRLVSHLNVSLTSSNLGKWKDTSYGLFKVYSMIEESSEYILKNWDRITVGPQYFIDSHKVGGFFSYVFVWEHLHLSLGINSRNLFAVKAIRPSGFVYWRF